MLIQRCGSGRGGGQPVKWWRQQGFYVISSYSATVGILFNSRVRRAIDFQHSPLLFIHILGKRCSSECKRTERCRLHCECLLPSGVFVDFAGVVIPQNNFNFTDNPVDRRRIFILSYIRD